VTGGIWITATVGRRWEAVVQGVAMRVVRGAMMPAEDSIGGRSAGGRSAGGRSNGGRGGGEQLQRRPNSTKCPTMHSKDGAVGRRILAGTVLGARARVGLAEVGERVDISGGVGFWCWRESLMRCPGFGQTKRRWRW